MYQIFCIHSSVEGHLGYFQLLNIITKAAMNIVEHVSLLQVGISSGYMPRKGIAGSSSSTMSNFLRNGQTDFQSGCMCLQSHQQWRSFPLSPHPCQNLLLPEFLILAILTGVRWNLRVVLICISLMVKDVGHFSGASQPFGIPQLRIFLLTSLCTPFLIGLLDFLESIFLSYLYSLDISPLSDLQFVKMLSQSVGGLFVLLTVSFALQKLCNIMRFHLSILDLIAKAIAVLFSNFFSPKPISSRLFPTLSSINFSVSGFMWSSLIHLDLSFVQVDKNGSIYILLHDNCQLCQHHLLKMLSFFPLDGFSSFSMIK
jgi:hypothetical protein